MNAVIRSRGWLGWIVVLACACESTDGGGARRDADAGLREDATTQDARPPDESDAAREASVPPSEGGTRSDAASKPFAPALACVVPSDAPLTPPDAAAPPTDAQTPDASPSDSGASDAASGSDADADACAALDCQDLQIGRWIGSGVSVTETYYACCAEGGVCGVSIDAECYARDQAGVADGACPDGCCRPDGLCGKSAGALGCTPSDDPVPTTCRAAAGPNPGACACSACSEQLAACAADPACTAIIECRAGRTDERPTDPAGYALADALDACLEGAGCDRLEAVGICREACPSGWAGGVILLVDLVGCCREDGFCGVLESTDGACILYDDPPLSGAPRSLSGPPPTCRAASLPHPDPCACDACEDALLACARDPGCVAISECRVDTGCTGAECEAANTCLSVMEQHGGPSGASAAAAAAVESCLGTAGCSTRQFGYCR